MNVPKPKPPAKKPSPAQQETEVKKESKPSPKKPYVLKPHLTDRPFKNNESLRDLGRRLASQQKH